MTKVVQARLDQKTHAALETTMRRLGRTQSEVIRDAINFFVSCSRPAGKRIQGIGKFSSGRSDLASNKAHLQGFGR